MKASLAKWESWTGETRGTLAAYEVGAEVDRGRFGRVLKGKRKVDNRAVMIREVSPGWIEYAKREAELWKAMAHPNIAKCYDAFDEADKFYMVTEAASEDPPDIRALVEQRGRLPQKEVAGFLKRIASALAYVHKKGFVHFAVAPSNLLFFPDGEVKLSNFRAGRRQGYIWDDEHAHHPGPDVWLPVEFFVSGNQRIESAADVYMLGVTCYYCLTGSPPFDSAADICMKSPEPLPASVSAPFAACVMKMLSKEARVRPTCREVLAQDWLCMVEVIW